MSNFSNFSRGHLSSTHMLETATALPCPQSEQQCVERERVSTVGEDIVGTTLALSHVQSADTPATLTTFNKRLW
jgi:hypothetical protein